MCCEGMSVVFDSGECVVMECELCLTGECGVIE